MADLLSSVHLDDQARNEAWRGCEIKVSTMGKGAMGEFFERTPILTECILGVFVTQMNFTYIATYYSHTQKNFNT